MRTYVHIYGMPPSPQRHCLNGQLSISFVSCHRRQTGNEDFPRALLWAFPSCSWDARVALTPWESLGCPSLPFPQAGGPAGSDFLRFLSWQSLTSSALLSSAGLGANDWMTTAVALHLLRKLMDDCQASHGMHFYIMVVGNPDGYHNSLLGQMTWTKNLHSFAGHCMGVCLPFNFPYYFNYGTMGSLCSPFYRGPSPMSEVETRAIVETLEQINNKHKLVMLLDLQQPGQSIVLPFSWNHINPEDYEAMRSLASTYTEAIRLNHNVYYDVNHNGYAMGGTLTEYAKNLLGIKYSYKIFLSIDVRYLFQPHPMRTLVPQVWTGLTAMLRELQKERVQEARKALSALPKGQDE